MGSIYSEFLKLKRSMSWAVVLLLPIIMVTAGTTSTISGGGEFNGWHILWIRSIGFYGMAIVSVGIAILASLVWRVEHKSGNWNALMSRPVPTSQVVLGKIAAISILAAAMQIIFALTVIATGKALGLPGMLPGQYLISSALVIVACVPVAALQSALSTFLRSFAVPVAIALVLTGASTMALLLNIQAISVVPYAALTRATQIGTILVSGERTSFDAAALTPESALLVIVISAVSTAVIIAATAVILNRSDTRT